MSKNKVRTYILSELTDHSQLEPKETRLLWQHLLKKGGAFIIAHPETKISPKFYTKFKSLERRRLNGWPLAYLTGHQEFYGLDFAVSPAVLIPRPDSELIIDSLQKKITELNQKKSQNKSGYLIIDIGTGSGALLITTAKILKTAYPTIFKNSRFSGLDISRCALNLAKLNATRHRLSKYLNFYQSNLLKNLKPKDLKVATSKPIIIIANLPYLTPDQINNSPTIAREPRLALNGGRDGLKYYRRLFSQIKNLKHHWGRPIMIFCEIDSTQNQAIKKLAKKYFPDVTLNLELDLGKKPRLLELEL